MTVSERLESDEEQVFASAAPVPEEGLVSGSETPEKETDQASKEEAPKVPTGGKARQAAGRPTWHLSLTLGLVIALAGGVLLWMQSPALALLVGGALVVLVGLALALWHLFGSDATGRRAANRRANDVAARATGNRGSDTSRRQAAGSDTRRGATSRDTGGTSRATRANRRGTRDGDTDPRGATRRRRRGTDDTRDPAPRGRRRDRATEPRGTGGTPRDRGGQPRQPRATPPGGGRPQQPRGVKDPTGGRQPAPNAERNPYRNRNRNPYWNRDRDRPGFWRERTCVNGGRPPITKVPKAEDAAADEGKRPVRLKPLRWRSRRGKLPVPQEPRPARAKVTKPPREPRRPNETSVEWPNVDQDHYEPVIASKLPRITHARRAVKLPPIYHRKGEPQWPTDDEDQRGPTVPPQRDRRGTVVTPDQMTRADWEAHCSRAANLATKAAQAKDELATRALQEAQLLDGMDDPEMREAQANHLHAASRAALDGEVRRHKAAIWSSLGQNPV